VIITRFGLVIGFIEGVEMAETTVRNFYAAGFDTLVKQWDKHISVGGGYVEK
jgi:hypothetical protein